MACTYSGLCVTVSTVMTLMTYKPRPRAANKPLVTVSPKGFRFSAEAVRKAGLESAHWVRISSDESERLIGFEFLDDPSQPEHANKLMLSTGIGRSCKAKGLINGNRWIKQVAEDDHGEPRNSKFELFPYPPDQKVWVIRLAPWFELSVLPEDIGTIAAAKGIYRYRDAGGEVIYIGKGHIAGRYREERQRRDWGIARIEYSTVPGDEQYKWEKFHLDAFAKEHADRLPLHNGIQGQPSR